MPLMGTTFLDRLKVSVASLELGLLKFMFRYSLLRVVDCSQVNIDHRTDEPMSWLGPCHPTARVAKKQFGATSDTCISNELLDTLIRSEYPIRCTYYICQGILIGRNLEIYHPTFSVAGMPYLAYKITEHCSVNAIEVNPNEGRSLWLQNRT
jgi:hypothetical protein